MIHDVSLQWIPIATTPAGSTLTWQNWQDCGIHTLAFHLDALLIKPELGVLQSFRSLRDFTGWSGKHILNASCSSGRDKNGSLHLTSRFDGSRVSIKHEALCELIVHLAPDAVIVPIWLEEAWMAYMQHQHINITAWFACQDSIYQSEHNPSRVYVVDAADRHQIPKSSTQGFFENDKPLQDALSGCVDTTEGLVNVRDAAYAQSFIPLDAHCVCPVCSQGLTRAYLHHLDQHTPLLAHRFLMMHHVFYHASLK